MGRWLHLYRKLEAMRKRIDRLLDDEALDEDHLDDEQLENDDEQLDHGEVGNAHDEAHGDGHGDRP